MSAQSDASVVAVRRLFTEVFQQGKLDVADEVLDPDFRFQYPFPGFAAGPEGIKEFTKTFHTAIPNFELEINDLIGGDGEHGARVAIRWTLRGKHSGSLLGLPPSHKYVTLSAIGFYAPGQCPIPPCTTLGSGWLELDTLGLLQQMEAVKPLHELLPNLRDKS